MMRSLLLFAVGSVLAYDPDVDLTTPQIIRRHGYSVEAHTVLTEDGYLLTIHRITGRKTVTTSSPHTSTTTFTPATNTTTPSPHTTTTTFTLATNTTTPSPHTTTTTFIPATNTTTPSPYTTTTTFTPATNTTTPSPHTTTTTFTPATNTTTPLPHTTTTTFTPATNTTTPSPHTTTTTFTSATNTITPSPHTTITTFTPATNTTTLSPATNTTPPSPHTTTTTFTPATNTTTFTPPTTTKTTTFRPKPIPTARLPIFLQHGLLGSSADWILSGPENALAYLLADLGYDVWLGNARGNTYSRAHVTLPVSGSEFWNFTWHEMGYYDLPAAIDYVLGVTQSKSLVYVGHSMGTTMFYVMAASRPEYNSKVRAMFSLAPVVYMAHLKSPIRLLAPYTRDIEFIFHLLGEDEFLPQSKILHLLAKYGCLLVATEKRICENIIFLLAGFDASQFDMRLLPVVLSHSPAGASTKTIIHYSQEIRSGKFQQYDYGPTENYHVYNQSTPPEYDLTLITVPIEIHYAKNDWLAQTQDVEKFYGRLKNGTGKYLVEFPEFNHLDFLYGKDAKSQVYDIVISHIKKISPPSKSGEMFNLLTSDAEKTMKTNSRYSQQVIEDGGELYLSGEVPKSRNYFSANHEYPTKTNLRKLKRKLLSKVEAVMEGLRENDSEYSD